MAKYALKPRRPVLNLKHPMVKGLIFCDPITAPIASGRDLVSNIRSTNIAGLTAFVEPYGISASGDGTAPNNGDIKYTTTPAMRNATKYTFAFWLKRLGASSDGFGRAYYWGQASEHSCVFNHGGFSNDLAFSMYWSSTPGVWSIPTPDTSPHFYVITYDSSSTSNSPTWYKDGVAQSLTVRNSPVGTFGTNDKTILHLMQAVGGETWQGTLGNMFIWNRILTPNEVKRLTANPWIIFKRNSFKKNLF